MTSSETRSVCVKQALNTRRWLVNALVTWHVSYKITTLNFTPIIFSSKFIFTDWSIPRCKMLDDGISVFKVIFLCQTLAGSIYLFFIEEYEIRRRTLISDTFWLSLFLKHFIFKNFAQFLACFNQFDTNANEKINSVEFISGPIFLSCSLFGPKLQNCNHAE